MAEAGTGSGKTFSKVFQRTVFRTKEKVLQNLGKADKTTDDAFEQHVSSFNEQQIVAVRLQKELKHYVACVKEMSLASQNMYRAIKDVYEPEWTGFTEVTSAVEQLTGLWEDYTTKLVEQLQNPLSNYVAQFQEYKAKIAKRNRKLTDYDGARHNYDSANAAKKTDDVKIAKATEEMNEAKRIYEVINDELHEELPCFYSSRVVCIASHVNVLCCMEAVFQSESAKLKNIMADVSYNLSQESYGSTASGGQSSLTPDTSRFLPATSPPPLSDPVPIRIKTPTSSPFAQKGNGLAKLEMPEPSTKSEPSPVPPVVTAITGNEDNRSSSGSSVPVAYNGKSSDVEPSSPIPKSPQPQNNDADIQPQTPEVHQTEDHDLVDDVGSESVKVLPADTSNTASESPGPSNGLCLDSDLNNTEITQSVTLALAASESVVPENRVLFKVLATHKYVGEDLDELTFEAGEIITVVPFDDPELQDDGWLMGVKETTKEKGVFPENFTKRI